jgi:hypothetical protein
MESNQAACACVNVKYTPIHNPDGTLFESWCCRDCGTAFVRRFWLQQAEAYAAEVSQANSFLEEQTAQLLASRAQLEARVRELTEALDEIAHDAQHNIPYYAYGDNQAACEMADRLSRIREKALAQKEG